MKSSKVIEGFRGQLPYGGNAWTGMAAVSESLKKSLQSKDPQLELIQVGNKVKVYRIKLCGTTPSQDYLIYEFTLDKPPGPWLIDHLNKHDIWAKQGNDPTKNFNTVMNDLDESDRIFERNRDLRLTEQNIHLAKELWTYAVRGRKSLVMS